MLNCTEDMEAESQMLCDRKHQGPSRKKLRTGALETEAVRRLATPTTLLEPRTARMTEAYPKQMADDRHDRSD